MDKTFAVCALNDATIILLVRDADSACRLSHQYRMASSLQKFFFLLFCFWTNFFLDLKLLCVIAIVNLS